MAGFAVVTQRDPSGLPIGPARLAVARR